MKMPWWGMDINNTTSIILETHIPVCLFTAYVSSVGSTSNRTSQKNLVHVFLGTKLSYQVQASFVHRVKISEG